MTLDQLKQLETLLADSEDFSEIFSFFMDHFADHQSFINQSKKTKAPLVKAIVKQAAEAVFRKIPILITKMIILSHDRLSLLHGGGFVEGKLFNFFYCKRTNKGLLVITTRGGSTEFVRITPQPADTTILTEGFMESVESYTVEYKNKFPN